MNTEALYFNKNLDAKKLLQTEENCIFRTTTMINIGINNPCQNF